MKQSTLDLITTTQAVMERRYPGYDDLPTGERVLLAMAYLCDAVKVREVGNNRGEWVEAFLDAAGVGPGNPWCASALTFACKVAMTGYPGSNPAAVQGWWRWFARNERQVASPRRGDVCMHESGGGKGHIGIVVRSFGLWVVSIEGNTSSGEAGSQRDGDGLYRRTRLKRFWSWGFGRFQGS